MLKVGQEVIRVKGANYQMPARGQIVEIKDQRLRVYWHTQPNGLKPKRTWVSFDTVKAA